MLNSAAKTVKQTQFRSYDHEIFTEEIKIALSPKDDKRIILQDGIHTLPHGHWRTKHSGLHVVDINLKKLRGKGSLMSLAYNKLCDNNVISKNDGDNPKKHKWAVKIAPQNIANFLTKTLI